MSSRTAVQIREFAAADLDGALALWSETEGLGLNESDTHEALHRFLDRNRGFSAVATSADGCVVGTVLCGHDGRRGTINHLAVAVAYRRQGIAARLLEHCFKRLEQAQVPRCNVFIYNENAEGTKFWARNGFEAATTWKTLQKRLDLNRD
jgi:putative acetyltransferase